MNPPMLTLQTRYFGPTDTRGARIKVTRLSWVAGDPKPRTYPFPYAEQNPFLAAARQYAIEIGMPGDLVDALMAIGDTPDGRGYIFHGRT